jgi:hypothetical protein
MLPPQVLVMIYNEPAQGWSIASQIAAIASEDLAPVCFRVLLL